VRRLRDPLLRLAYRAGFRVMRVWWLVVRPTVRGVKCVLTRDGEILLVRHTYGDRRLWELPGGGLKRREQPVEGARREIHEELGIEVDDWRSLGDLFERIDHKRDRMFCFSSEIGDREIDLDLAEIGEAAWFPDDALPNYRAKYVARIVALRDAGGSGASDPRPAARGAPRPDSPPARG
jgi:8-oxo-dGTP pyrophosphatase MutT (NUDIX family)